MEIGILVALVLIALELVGISGSLARLARHHELFPPPEAAREPSCGDAYPDGSAPGEDEKSGGAPET